MCKKISWPVKLYNANPVLYYSFVWVKPPRKGPLNRRQLLSLLLPNFYQIRVVWLLTLPTGTGSVDSSTGPGAGPGTGFLKTSRKTRPENTCR